MGAEGDGWRWKAGRVGALLETPCLGLLSAERGSGRCQGPGVRGWRVLRAAARKETLCVEFRLKEAGVSIFQDTGEPAVPEYDRVLV